MIYAAHTRPRAPATAARWAAQAHTDTLWSLSMAPLSLFLMPPQAKSAGTRLPSSILRLSHVGALGEHLECKSVKSKNLTSRAGEGGRRCLFKKPYQGTYFAVYKLRGTFTRT